MSIKIVIAGSRDFNSYDILKDKFLEFAGYYDFNSLEIVSGTARGADQLGEKLAEELGIKVARFPADWDQFGKGAGYRRNAEMADYGDVLLAFWDGKSRGTRMMIELARKKGLLVQVFICEHVKHQGKSQWYVDAIPYKKAQ
jgi:hypothetical protein